MELVRRKEESYCDVLAFSWMDCERRFFICSDYNRMDGEPNIKRSLRQENEELNAEPDTLGAEISRISVIWDLKIYLW